MSDLFSLLPQVDFQQGPWVLVTLIDTQGSTYRNVGARLLVSPTGPLGMISGGCLEADIARRCAPLLQGEVPALEMTIDTRHLLGCDGRLTLVAETLTKSLAEEVMEVANTRQSRVLSTFRPGPAWQGSVVGEQALSEDFHEELLPPRRLLVFGSTPGARPLLEMGRILGWQAEQVVLSSDPRSVEPKLEATLLSHPSQIKKLSPDPWTPCVVMNHHVGRDLEVVRSLWHTPIPFLGLLGSRRRRDEILEGLAFASGQPEIDLDARKLYAPVGLSLGGEGPADIALEICAQIQQVMSCTLNQADSPYARAHSVAPF